jgi:FixJ family two-component response regulator
MSASNAATSEPTVFIIDDDDALRQGLMSLFRSVGLLAKEFGSVSEFQQDKMRNGPGCLVLDVRLPGKSGLDLQAELGQAHVEIPIVFISGHADVPMSVRALKAGAMEFLVKPFREQDLLDAVRNGIERDREQREKQRLHFELRTRYEMLTPRERQVCSLVVRGLMNKQIAGDLGISLITVKVHRGNVMQKMGARSLAALVRMGDAVVLPPVKAEPASSPISDREHIRDYGRRNLRA